MRFFLTLFVHLLYALSVLTYEEAAAVKPGGLIWYNSSPYREYIVVVLEPLAQTSHGWYGWKCFFLQGEKQIFYGTNFSYHEGQADLYHLLTSNNKANPQCTQT